MRLVNALRPTLVLVLGFGACSNWEADGSVMPSDEDAGLASTGSAGSAGASSCPAAFDPGRVEPRNAARGFRVVANRIVDSRGAEVVLRGVNRSGTEYQCTKGTGLFDGPGTEQSVRGMARWGINAVRVPLAETCWLNLAGVVEDVAGENYKRAIVTYVGFLQKYGLTPILDLHWAAPGNLLPNGLLPMPNADHSEAFWIDVAMTFLDNDGVVLEPFNEPFPDRNRNSEAAWQCWRDGCDAFLHWSSDETYEAVGMQALVDAIRSTGSEHLILLGGVQYSNSLSRWLEYKPEDPIDNLAAAWHIYNFNSCVTDSCWNAAPLEVSEEYPIVATELGHNDCQGEFLPVLIEWLDSNASGYLAWTWNVLGRCVPGSESLAWGLITDYACPEPNSGYAETFYEALQR